MPNTRNAENVLRSAWIPAPPPESEPATVNALGTPIDPRSIRAALDPCHAIDVRPVENTRGAAASRAWSRRAPPYRGAPRSGQAPHLYGPSRGAALRTGAAPL